MPVSLNIVTELKRFKATEVCCVFSEGLSPSIKRLSKRLDLKQLFPSI